MKKLIITSILTVIILLAGKAVLAVNEGNIGIYTETEAGDSMSTSEQDLTWDTTVRQDSSFEMQSGSSSVRILEDGLYLMLYNLPTYYEDQSTNDERQEIQTKVKIGGSSQDPFGSASGYIRSYNGGQYLDFQSGANIFSHTYDSGTLSNNDLEIVWYNTDNSTAHGVATSTIDGDQAGLMLLKLNSSWPYSAYSISSGSQSHTAPAAKGSYDWSALLLDTNDSNDGSTIDHSTLSDTDDINLSASGHYLAAYSVHFNNVSASARSNGVTRLTLNGVEVDGSRSVAYVRGSDSNQDGWSSWVGIINATNSSITLNIEASVEGESSANMTTPDIGISIVKLPDTAEYLMTVLSSDTNLTTTETAISWQYPLEIDTDSFSWSASNPSRITIDSGISSNDFLFLSGQYNYRNTAGDANRAEARLRYRKNGSTIYAYGSHGGYNRGDQSSTGTFGGGSAGGIIDTLSGNDYIELMAEQVGNSSVSDLDLIATTTAIQAVNLTTLFAETEELVSPTEFVAIIDPDNASSSSDVVTDYTSLAAWEAAIQADMTSASTTVHYFATSTAVGVFPDGATVIGETSGAIATSTHRTGTSTNDSHQIMMTNVVGEFLNGEKVYIEGASSNYIYLTSTATPVIAVAQCRSTAGTADQTAVTIDGWETSSSTYIKIWTDPDDPYGRHQGKWDDGKYHMSVSGSSYSRAISVNENYTILDGLQIRVLSIEMFSIYTNGEFLDKTVQINNNILTSASDALGGIWVDNGIVDTGYNIFIKNNIIYGSLQTFGSGIRIDAWWTNVHIYNNTLYQNYRGVYIDKGNATLINNAVFDSTDNDYSGQLAVLGSANNCSSDNTANYSSNMSNSIVNAVANDNFVDIENFDFHLKNNSPIKDAGTSSLPILPTYDPTALHYDIDGTARGAAFDIGADEVPVEFVSTICQATTTGGDCNEMDYSYLAQWENAVETDLTASTTRVFSGAITGQLSENNLVYLYDSTISTTSAYGYVVATTSDQILIDGIVGSSTIPLTATSGDIWYYNGSNYWTVSGTLDDLGASPIAIAKIDGTWTESDTNELTISSWSTDIDNKIKIYTTDTARHKGKYTSDAYTLYGQDENAINTHETPGHYITIDGLQIRTNNNNGIRIVIPGQFIIKNNIIWQDSYSTTANKDGIIIQSGYQGYVNTNDDHIYNNIIYGFINDNNHGIYSVQPGNYNHNIYNNTIYNCKIGIAGSTGNTVIINNIIASTTDPFNSSFDSASANNATDGNDSPGIGYNNLSNITINFISTASGTEDLRLRENNPDLINAGFDISASSTLNVIPNAYSLTPNAYSDIEGAARDPDGLGWDIGADETPAKQYRSVGNDSSDLSNGGTVTISSTTRTATFSTGQPDNIGVGDVIQFGGAGYYDLAFISGRTSSTTYSVQNYDTKAPTATTSASFAIYRAHLLLDDWEDQLSAQVNSGVNSSVENKVLVSKNLIASNTTLMVSAYASINGDTRRFTVDNNWSTSIQNYIKIYAPDNFFEVGISQKHNGVWDDNKYNLIFSNSSNNSSAINITTSYAYIEGLQLNVVSSAYQNHGIYIGGNGYFTISKTILKGNFSGSANGGGVYTHSAGSGYIIINNNIVYGFQQGLSNQYGPYQVNFYNNTLVNCANGIYADSNDIAINNITKNCTDGFNNTPYDSSSDYNLSDIAGDQPASGANDIMGIDVEFWDEANNDYHLAPGSPGIDQGTSTLELPPSYSPIDLSYDIDGDKRRTWDIGADEASVEFVSTVMETGGDFSSLSAWEAANQVDLTATTTAVFDCSTATGTIPVGSSVIGTSSFAVASTTVMSTSSSQILLYNIASSTFVTGEKIIIEGSDGSDNYCILGNAGNPAIAVAKIDGGWSGADGTKLDINGWETSKYNYIKIYTTQTARHNGKWDTNKYVFDHSTTGFDITENHVVVDGLQFNAYHDGDNHGSIRISGVDDGNNIENIIISNNILWSSGSGNNRDGINVVGVLNMIDIIRRHRPWRRLGHRRGRSAGGVCFYYLRIKRGGDCSALGDYTGLYDWEEAVDCDLTASTTRVFSGTAEGALMATLM
jgi:hypothetical protein